MTPFLKQIARHYCTGSFDLSSMVFVFPSHRALVFFRKWLGEVVSEEGNGPCFEPMLLSIDDFFRKLSPLKKADGITLLLELYEVYCRQCAVRGQTAELLDDFVFWGDIILADFSDVDKYCADAKDLFRNVSQLKDMQDDYSDLSDIQKDALKRFLGLFEVDGEYKQKFARMWNMLSPIYYEFNEALKAKGLSYEGMLYRSIAERVEKEGAGAVLHSAFPECEKLVFCGLNALNECEKKIFRHFRDLSLADFCWDYCSEWIKDSHNKSSLFLKDNVAAFPQAFPLEPCSDTPEIEVVSVPSSVGQTKVLSRILEDENIPKNERTAILIPDESLLVPLLDSIPENVRNINVTMGCSMASSSFYSLMGDIGRLQMNIRMRDGKAAFYYKPVWSIVGNNVFAALADEATKEKVAAMKQTHRYYVGMEELCGTPLLDAVFKPAFSADADNAKKTEDIRNYLLEVLDFIGKAIVEAENTGNDLSLELDFAMEYSKSVQLLGEKSLDVRPDTYFRLLDRLLSSKSIPFKGEPLTGLQIMGPLEIRALDFDCLFILSSNEAVFPGKSMSPSFIPPMLRRGFGLPTYEYQDAVWAYYFYRMIQRPSKVWMLLDSRTEGLKSGEESRYIKQLEYHFNARLKRSIASSVPVSPQENAAVPKTADIISKLHSKPLSASAIKAYLSCPVKFYYSFIEGLAADEDVSENMDASMIGNAYHHVMQHLYGSTADNLVSVSYLESCIRDKEGIKKLVEEEMMKELCSDTIQGRDLVVSSILQKYVIATLSRDREQLTSKGKDHFRVLGVETDSYARFTAHSGSRDEEFLFKGRLDRLDTFEDGIVRVVDYKTGRVLEEDISINDGNADSIAGKIFAPSVSKRPEIALQFFIYDYLMRNASLEMIPGKKDRKTVSEIKEKLESGWHIANTVYSTRKIMKEIPRESFENDMFIRAMISHLSSLLMEMCSPDIPFNPCDDTRTCEYCDFRTICAR